MGDRNAPFFDYPRVAREAGIAQDDLEKLVRVVYTLYEGDDMLASLHVLRTCRAVRDGHCAIREAIEEWRAEAEGQEWHQE